VAFAGRLCPVAEPGFALAGWLAVLDLDRAVVGGRDLGGHLDGLAAVRALDDQDASDLFLGLGERPVGDHDPAVATTC